MTRYSDNIYSGFQALTSAASSKSAVVLSKGPYNFSGAGNATAVTRTGTFPPGTQNLIATLYITNNGSATVSNKITVSAGGTNLVTITSFGSAQGVASYTTGGVATFTYVASACQSVPVPATNQTNGGEIPFSVTFLPVSADKIGTYSVVLDFNRSDSNTLGVSS